MRFGPVPVGKALGHILGHNVSDDAGRRALRKGRPLTEEDIELLRSLGREAVYVAQLEPGDVVLIKGSRGVGLEIVTRRLLAEEAPA